MRKFFVVAAIVISSQLQGQDSTMALTEVIVTANKMQQKQSTTGKVVSVITKEQIERSNGRTISQLLNEQAGITVNGAFNNLGTNQTLYTRGAASGRTLVLVDGIPVNDPSQINNEFDLNFIAVNNVERIEICRGAQSTLYGSDAIAGVVNIITVKDNIAKPFQLKATGSAGNYGTYRGNVQLYGRSGNVSYVTRYAKLRSGGFSAAFDTAAKSFDRDGYNSDAASASVQWKATEALSFRTFAQYSRYHADIDLGPFRDERDFTTGNRTKMIGGSFRFSKSNVTVTGNYQYSDVDRNYRNDSTYKDGFETFGTNDYYGKNQFAELYASIALGGGFTLLQGADYRYNSMNQNLFSLSSFGPYLYNFKDTAHSQSSLYASLLYHQAGGKLNIELGGRLNVHSRYGSNHTFTFNPSYNITEHFRIFGSIASGFKAPALFQLFGPNRPAATILKPERSTTYEAGVQHQYAKFQNRIVLFYRTINDGLDFNYNNFQYFNFLRQQVKGIEWEASVQPVKALQVTANYTFLSAKETTQSRLNFKDTVYTYLLRRPNHQVNLMAGYQFNNSLYFSVSGRFVSDRFDVGGYQKSDALLGSYVLFNAYAAYSFGTQLKLFADAQNIGNKKFFDVYGYNSLPFLFHAGFVVNL